MPKKRFSAEQIVKLLRQIEVSMAQGKSAPEYCRAAGISQQSFYRWRKKYGGLEIDQAKRMKDLERENAHRAKFGRHPFSESLNNIGQEQTLNQNKTLSLSPWCPLSRPA